MSKKIFASNEDISKLYDEALQAVKERMERLKTLKFAANEKKTVSVSFDIPDAKDDKKATLLFKPDAWIKMYALINSFSTEVEWHGTASRVDETTFMVDDILLFPHQVSAATVTSDQKAYEEWVDSLDNDTFDRLRFHGHSHVNMATSPSGVDREYRNNILRGFGTPRDDTDYFYVFLIGNKRGEIEAEIYDLQNNAMYSNDEIDVEVELADGDSLKRFVDTAKELTKPPIAPAVQKQSKSPTPYYTPSREYSNYFGGTAGTPAKSSQSKSGQDNKKSSNKAPNSSAPKCRTYNYYGYGVGDEDYGDFGDDQGYPYHDYYSGYYYGGSRR